MLESDFLQIKSFITFPQDEPVGSGTGKYKDRRLFYTRQNHASLIPLMGLMREYEYDAPLRTWIKQNIFVFFNLLYCFYY